MTVAVCLECGRMKAGAWTSCPHCNFQPHGEEELAKSLMVSDQWVPSDILVEFAARRQLGEQFNFEPELVEQFKQRVVALIPLTQDGLPVRSQDMQQLPAEIPALSVEAAPFRKPWWRFWN
ncbi:MAG: hypothetical protein H8K03_19425 [Nitrospira sp.]